MRYPVILDHLRFLLFQKVLKFGLLRNIERKQNDLHVRMDQVQRNVHEVLLNCAQLVV